MLRRYGFDSFWEGLYLLAGYHGSSLPPSKSPATTKRPLAVGFGWGLGHSATQFTSSHPEAIGLLNAFLAVLLVWSAALVTLLIGQTVAQLLGRRGLVATERLMGMVLSVIAVHIILTRVEKYFAAM
ncbi:MAG: MarC family protein [bacterium]